MSQDPPADEPVGFSPVPFVAHSGRRPHVRRIRAHGWREFIISHGWAPWGGYSRKIIRGCEMMLTIAEQHEDYFLCVFRPKHDYWSAVTAKRRQEQAEALRRRFRSVSLDQESPATTTGDITNKE